MVSRYWTCRSFLLGLCCLTTFVWGTAAREASAQPVGRAIRLNNIQAVQIEQDPFNGPVQEDAVDEGDPMGEADATSEIEIPAPEVAPPDPQEIRLVLLDGSVVSGNLSIAELNVTTDFGPLTIPIDRIRQIRPGLVTYAQLKAQLDGLVEDLGSELFDEREAAQRELLGFGTKIRLYLSRLEDDGDSERQSRLKTIREALEEQDQFSDEDSEVQSWIEGDTIITDRFTIVGKIENAQFELDSRYGKLVVDLFDVDYGTREWGGRSSQLKSLKLSQANFVQRQMQTSRLRVQQGDRVIVRVEGNFNLVPWGQMSTPEGAAQCGTYMGKFPVGSVVAKIGNGELIAIGSDETFTARNSGTLTFGIVMMDNFVNQGYDWSGEYQVRVKVEPQ